MKFGIRLIGTTKFLSNMRRIQKKVPDATRMAMFYATELLRGYIVKYKLSGQKLKRRTGKLAGSIQKEVHGQGDEVIGRVGSNLEYAAIHEMGGPRKPITIVPVRAKALHFFIGKNEIFCRAVHMPAFAIKAKYYIKSSMRETRRRSQEILGQRIFMELGSGR